MEKLEAAAIAGGREETLIYADWLEEQGDAKAAWIWRNANRWDLEQFCKDPDWERAFHQAIMHDYGHVSLRDCVDHVYCAVEGENDGDSWLAVVKWNSLSQLVPVRRREIWDALTDLGPRYTIIETAMPDPGADSILVIEAGCDYTGWD